MVQRTTRQTEGTIVNLPNRLGGAFWIASAIMAMNVSRRKDNRELPMDFQIMCVLSRVINETFEAARHAESQGRLTDDWMHPAFNDMMVVIWFGFPPTHEGVKQLESHFASLHLLMQWNGMPGPAMSVDAGELQLPLVTNVNSSVWRLDWNEWAQHSALTFGLDDVLPGTLYQLDYPLFNMEEARQLHLHRYAYLKVVRSNEGDVDMEERPIPFWETEDDGDRLPLPPQRTPLDPSLAPTLSWARSSGDRATAAWSTVEETFFEDEVPVGGTNLVDASLPAEEEANTSAQEQIKPQGAVALSKTFNGGETSKKPRFWAWSHQL
jgi:hypothetical protein